jgi:hypothetical protein
LFHLRPCVSLLYSEEWGTSCLLLNGVEPSHLRSRPTTLASPTLVSLRFPLLSFRFFAFIRSDPFRLPNVPCLLFRPRRSRQHPLSLSRSRPRRRRRSLRSPARPRASTPRSRTDALDRSGRRREHVLLSLPLSLGIGQQEDRPRARGWPGSRSWWGCWSVRVQGEREGRLGEHARGERGG